jgi:hypothetical protein
VHFVAVVVRATVLDAIAAQSLGYAVAGNSALIVIGGLAEQK